MRVSNALVRAASPVLPAVACCGVPFAPWATTGTAARSGFAFLRAASSAGLLGSTMAHLLEALVFALPVLAALSCAAAILGTTFISGISSGVAGVVVGAFSLEMFIVFGTHAAVGPWLGATIAVIAIAISAHHSAKVWPGRTPLTLEERKVQNA
jgi:hypothetical protein